MERMRLSHLGKTYPNAEKPVIQDFSLTVQEHEFIVFVGPSGCGKSTLLRMIAGLEEISHGDLQIDGRTVNELPAKDRGISMVFQNYALFPHLSVFENMAFGLRVRHYPRHQIQDAVNHAAQILGLESVLQKKPKALSGGQRQRVALGRAIVRQANIFLMDEPLSNLDAKLRTQMREEILSLHQRLQATTIYVTHDQTEAMTMASRIVVIKDGCVQQIGTPREIYQQPVNQFVAGFIGSPQMNFLPVTIDGTQLRHGDQAIAERPAALAGCQAHSIILGIRPEDMRLADEGLALTVAFCELLGPSLHVHAALMSSGEKLIVQAAPSANFQAGEIIHVQFPAECCHFFTREQGARLDGGSKLCTEDLSIVH